jgi:pyruvate formate lyase activating enzyme
VLPLKIAKQPKILEQDFFNFLKERVGKIEGVVICGGEPTINKDLINFVKKIKDLNFFVKLDTNGSNPAMLKDLVSSKLIDYVAMDIKGTPDVYEKIMQEGIKLEDIKESINFLKNSKIDFEFRTTAVPGIHTKKDFLEIAKWIGAQNAKYYLQNFRPEKTIDPEFEKIKPFENEFLEEIVKEISPYFKECKLRA